MAMETELMNKMVMDKLKELGDEFKEIRKEIADELKQLGKDMEELKRDIIEVKLKEDKLLELAEWKKRMEEITSPTQLDELHKSVFYLQQFKTTATTAFIAAQMVIGIVLALIKFL